MNVIFIGPAGSGKSVQAERLATELNVPHLNAGDLLYYASLGEDNEASLIREAMEKGELVDSSIATRLLDRYFSDPAHQGGVVIDGHPRTLEEAKDLKPPIDKVINIKLSDEVVKERLSKRGRHDDKPEIIQRRLDIYHEEMQPILDYYSSMGILVEIDGDRSIDEIAEDILNTVQK